MLYPNPAGERLTAGRAILHAEDAEALRHRGPAA